MPTPKVTCLKAMGPFVEIISDDEEVPGAFVADVRLGTNAGQ